MESIFGWMKAVGGSAESMPWAGADRPVWGVGGDGLQPARMSRLISEREAEVAVFLY